ncbi:hypothetical protein [Gelidibacter algens]|nr:hypothetical protein [Gelidibacter algens]
MKAIDGDFGDVLSNSSGNNLTSILNKMDEPHFNINHLDEITSRLGNTKYRIKHDLIENPGAFKDFDDMINEPGLFWEKYSNGDFITGSNLEKWAQWKWFKDLTQKARLFEDVTGLESFKLVSGITDNTKIVKQVTLEVNGTKIRIDYIGIDDMGLIHLGEAKFSTKIKNWSTDWLSASTKNQKIVFQLFEDNLVNSIIIKATDVRKMKSLRSMFGLSNTASIPPINFRNTSLSIFGSNANEQTIKSVILLK